MNNYFMKQQDSFNIPVSDVEYIYGLVWWGGVCKQSRWRHSVTEPSQDGGYVLLWQRYDNNKMAAMRYYGNVMTTTMPQHSDDVFYIFNSTVIDWTFVFHIFKWFYVFNKEEMSYEECVCRIMMMMMMQKNSNSTFCDKHINNNNNNNNKFMEQFRAKRMYMFMTEY